MEAGAHIAHFGSPVIRRDTIATTSAKMLIYFRYVHTIEDLGQNDRGPKSAALREASCIYDRKMT